MDKLAAAFISAGVALFIAILNHFIVTPCKEKRARKRSRLNNLYAPLYSLVSTRLDLVKSDIVINGLYMLGTKDGSKYLNKEYTEMYFLERSGYASDELIEAWIAYSGSLLPNQDKTKKFIFQIVKEYNQLKKELRMNYNPRELETGVPEVLKGVKISD